MRLFHLALHATLNRTVHPELFRLDVQHLGNARQPVYRIKDLQQFLLFFNGQLEIGTNRISQLARIVHPNGRDHRLVVQILAELDVLLKQGGNSPRQSFQLWTLVDLKAEGANHSPEEAFVVSHRNQLRPLHTLHQNLNVAVRQLQTLDNTGNTAHVKNLIWPGFIR